MTDRFKFRVWDKKAKTFIERGTLDVESGFLLEQCTGLKDKNGKLLYEGDVLGGLFGAPIAWCDTCKSFCLSFRGECMACSGDVMWAEVVEDDGELEVIGNIHENEELLK